MFYHPRRPSDTEALHRVIKSATYMPAFAKSRRQLPRQHQSGPTSSSDHHGVLGHRHTRHVRKCGRSTPIATLAPSINACAIGTESAAGAASTGAFGVVTEDVDRETRHAWKEIPAARADPHRHAPTHFPSTTFRDSDVYWTAPANHGVKLALQKVSDTVLTQHVIRLTGRRCSRTTCDLKECGR